MWICIKFQLNWDSITRRYMENNTVALRFFEEYIICIDKVNSQGVFKLEERVL